MKAIISVPLFYNRSRPSSSRRHITGSAQVALQQSLILRSSATILPCRYAFATGRFFVVNF
jgi:hypothetical protein